jgi:hypothetical protein
VLPSARRTNVPLVLIGEKYFAPQTTVAVYARQNTVDAEIAGRVPAERNDRTAWLDAIDVLPQVNNNVPLSGG